MKTDTSHWATSEIDWSATGLYMAYPTSNELKPIYRNYKTRVNCDHTKVGVASDSFLSRYNNYRNTFDGEVEFVPLIQIPRHELKDIEDLVKPPLKRAFGRVGYAREWFNTNDRNAVLEVIEDTLQVRVGAT